MTPQNTPALKGPGPDVHLNGQVLPYLSAHAGQQGHIAVYLTRHLLEGMLELQTLSQDLQNGRVLHSWCLLPSDKLLTPCCPATSTAR